MKEDQSALDNGKTCTDDNDKSTLLPNGEKMNRFGFRAPNDPRSVKAFNLGRSRTFPMLADDVWGDRYWYDAPSDDPEWPDVHTYTDSMTYAPGETVLFRTCTHAKQWSLEIVRDGLKPEKIARWEDLEGQWAPTPRDASKIGCGWPESHRWTIPPDTRSGFYKVISTCLRSDGTRYVQFHFFVVRPTKATQTSRLLMVLPTSTWIAYNNWGGSNYYAGIDGETQNRWSPILSTQRPWSRGVVWLPDNAPRLVTDAPAEGPAAPRYQTKEWSYANGFGFFYAAAGWAFYDRHFLCWAEREGIALDMITQHDLHFHSGILDDYKALVIVGHDEYWSYEMRKHVDAFVDRGGNVARFGGNFATQVRLEENGDRQVCYKDRALREDPVRDTDQKHLLTANWDSPHVAYPGAQTMGVNSSQGIYGGWGGFAPYHSKGFTVYRPDHWVFADTKLTYGDVFGDKARIFGYEVDGLDYTFRQGLPYPTGSDGAPREVVILAMAPAVKAETMFAEEGWRYYLGNTDMLASAQAMYGDTSPESVRKVQYGSGMLVYMPRGKGEVVCGATCDWVMGLARNDYFTTRITLNVLKRFTEDR
ncbi:N,N-dimethylformamidase beta subunit family domain-containing protein [Burkholderia pseudomultivorans]|uniref:N,N-dimethylformamidase large subunit n=1 Tax=Burkholderia pseudomultivorans TaxID=1207504 RepID=A0A6P2MXP8_9BURK|nr:N,N-dimethylformamidase beta subunit family domain-containing protein [Burkholderia pseudomultivorans]MDR8730109.1 hypothetical protein [Burkholderia pseudomultivorans]MDR8734694.1 hypothetical protein [Burkholderia pseudomultivorans]MDR8740660.1 hypothetical protein [Burkholderia pseudomultivorans]MDR8751675.1 hypothetical protein [Burkholderia pseudomultivorans]MDR8777074.1 hypothetical protein [Burkholderia pseudomultivorans]